MKGWLISVILVLILVVSFVYIGKVFQEEEIYDTQEKIFELLSSDFSAVSVVVDGKQYDYDIDYNIDWVNYRSSDQRRQMVDIWLVDNRITAFTTLVSKDKPKDIRIIVEKDEVNISIKEQLEAFLKKHNIDEGRVYVGYLIEHYYSEGELIFDQAMEKIEAFKYEEAIYLLKTRLSHKRFYNKSIEVVYWLAYCYKQQGKTEEIIKLFEKEKAALDYPSDEGYAIKCRELYSNALSLLKMPEPLTNEEAFEVLKSDFSTVSVEWNGTNYLFNIRWFNEVKRFGAWRRRCDIRLGDNEKVAFVDGATSMTKNFSEDFNKHLDLQVNKQLVAFFENNRIIENNVQTGENVKKYRTGFPRPNGLFKAKKLINSGGEKQAEVWFKQVLRYDTDTAIGFKSEAAILLFTYYLELGEPEKVVYLLESQKELFKKYSYMERCENSLVLYRQALQEFMSADFKSGFTDFVVKYDDKEYKFDIDWMTHNDAYVYSCILDVSFVDNQIGAFVTPSNKRKNVPSMVYQKFFSELKPQIVVFLKDNGISENNLEVGCEVGKYDSRVYPSPLRKVKGLMEEGWYERAVAHLKKHIREDRPFGVSVKATKLLAYCYLQLGEPEKVVELFETKPWLLEDDCKWGESEECIKMYNQALKELESD